jgi:hypothetical protein
MQRIRSIRIHRTRGIKALDLAMIDDVPHVVFHSFSGSSSIVFMALIPHELLENAITEVDGSHPHPTHDIPPVTEIRPVRPDDYPEPAASLSVSMFTNLAH